MTLRFGVIGYGRFGQAHAGGIVKAGNAELAAICTASEASAAAARKAYPNARVVQDWRELLEDPAIDVFDVVTPNHLHAEMTLAALEAGKHVLVEKPMATTVEDCARIVEAVDRTGRQLAVGFELRLSVQWGRIKALIDEGRIGRPRYVSVDLFRHPYRMGAEGWRQIPGQVGSWILEEPVHFYDLAMWYLADLGDPVAVAAHGTPFTGGLPREALDEPHARLSRSALHEPLEPGGAASGMYDNFTSTIRYEGGELAVISQTLAGFGHHLVMGITGTEGAIRATWSGADAASDAPVFDLLVGPTGMGTPERVDLDRTSGEIFELEEQIRLVADAFAEGRTLVGAREGARSIVACLEAERSVREGREVPLHFT